MKKIIIIVLAILTIVLYLSIGIAYNSSPIYSIFTTFKREFINFIWLKTNPFDNYSSQEINFGKLSSQIFWSLLLLFISTLLKNKLWLLLTSILVVGIWLKNYIIYGGIMDSNLYFKTSIPFFILILVLNIFNFIYKDKSVSNS